jgi:hypothetical protein
MRKQHLHSTLVNQMKSLMLYSLNRELLNREFSGFDGNLKLPYAQVVRRHSIKWEYSRKIEQLELEIKKLQMELKALKKREEQDGEAEVVAETSSLVITPQTSIWDDDQVQMLDQLLTSSKFLEGI